MENLSLESPSVSPAVPLDTGSDPVRLIELVRKLVNETGSEVLRREWRRLYARSSESRFAVAVVGEMSRGKSTLINRLLGADLLPVGPTPTTQVVARVFYGPEASLVAVLPDGAREPLAAFPEQASGESRWTAFQRSVPNEWLRETGLQLLDTPGAGESGRLEEILDIVAVCDAIVVTVSATMALSLRERELIERHILARHVPRILVVLTRLDEVSPTARAGVVRHVRERLASFGPEIVLATAHEAPVTPSEAEVAIAGPAAIAGILTSWAADPERHQRTRRQIHRNLLRILELVEADLATRRVALDLADGQRRQAAGSALRDLDLARGDWEELRLGMRERSEWAREWIHEQLAGASEAITERLGQELRRMPDPGAWWKQDLPVRLKQELGGAARTLADPLERQITADSAWLRHEVQTRFARRLAMAPVDLFEGFSDAEADGLEARDLRRARWRLRFGVAGATVLVSGLAVPVLGPFAGLGVGLGMIANLIGERLLDKKVDEQKDILRRELAEVVRRTVEQGATMAADRLRKAYESLLEETRRQEETWYAVRREALEKAPAGGEVRERLEAALAELRRCRSVITDGEEV